MRRKDFLGLSAAAAAGAVLPGFASARTFAGRAARAAGGPVTLTTTAMDLQLRHAWTLSRGTWSTRRNAFVRLEKDGIAGFGEAAPIARYDESADSALAFIEKARPLLASADLWEYHDLWLAIDALATGQHAAKAALDMAVLDWLCKSVKVPFHRFLGLSAAKTPVTTMTIGIDEVPVMQAKVKEASAFPVYKIKVGTPDDRKIIEGIRAVTDKPLRADANEGWTDRQKALDMIGWMAERGVELIEQPMPAARFDDYGWLKERSPIPVFADESLMTSADLARIAPAFHGVNIKLMKCGGPQEALRLVAAARALGLKLMLGCMVESSLGIAAAAAVSPLFDYADLDGSLLISNDPFRGPTFDNGKIILPDGPGLGAAGDVWR